MYSNDSLKSVLKKKILLLDGGMGTMIQKKKLSENQFRGEKFKSFGKSLKGNNDILNITNPKIIYEIHKSYLDAGADIIETNTFNSTKVSQRDYDFEKYSYDLNFEGGKIARKCVDDFMKKNPREQKFVAGVLGPTNRTCSMSPDVNDPGFRNITFDQLRDDYEISVEALTNANVDFILNTRDEPTQPNRAPIFSYSIHNNDKLLQKLIIDITVFYQANGILVLRWQKK